MACNGTASPRAARGSKTFGKDSEGGARRTQFAEAGEVEDVPLEAMIDREPVTVVCSQMGWIRAMKGHIDLDRELKFKDGDGALHLPCRDHRQAAALRLERAVLHALGRQPARRARHGRAVRLMVDLPNEAEIVALFIHQPGRKLLVASARATALSCPRTRSWPRPGRQAGAERARRCGAVCRNRCRAITSPWWARTARCWSSRSTSCPK
jgi:topoisomerase-4 subunit A